MASWRVRPAAVSYTHLDVYKRQAVGRYIANFIVGKLDSENPAKPYLIYCKPLDQTNHSTVARFINDGLKVLWPNGVKEEKVLLLYTDAAAYMLSLIHI